MRINYFDVCIKQIRQEKWLNIWFWGCERRCSGCGNKQTYDDDYKKSENVEDFIIKLNKFIDNFKICGIIITGGEPFLQKLALEYLLNFAKDQNWYTMVYTGYFLEEINKKYGKILKNIDVLIDGPFEKSKFIRHALFGSSNQKMYFFNKKLIYLNKIDENVSFYMKTMLGNIVKV